MTDVTHAATETYLVTGAMGCLGAWTLARLVCRGANVVALDLSDQRHRVDLLLDSEAQARVRFVTADLTDAVALQATFDRHGVTRVIHLAALQIPFCRQNPALGARVNVEGTINVFEAARRLGLRSVTYASSLAVYGPRERYVAGADGLVPSDAPLDPRTLYGAYKQANEATARVYWNDHGIASVGLRPYTVYGVGRDQGMTSAPTVAMLAAAAGQDAHIMFGGKNQFHFAPDVADLCIAAADSHIDGAVGYNLGGTPVAVAEVARTIESLRPGVRITVDDIPLPFPDGMMADPGLEALRTSPETALEDGVRRTIDHFERCFTAGTISAPLGA
jgi:UDP-glucuronate 4-epimerase